ncbi:hypothetical protein SELMODRAFT_431100 [Selaginella moellendorffii]|uniref:Uncharacterized protein n=1 Tax=Selaginella moellendorffii TaxID=88036 RepID=D8TBI7_SELML|nr:hypothetical protein SELMODRAFT_431100 [Selaginella moellendorffii]
MEALTDATSNMSKMQEYSKFLNDTGMCLHSSKSRMAVYCQSQTPHRCTVFARRQIKCGAKDSVLSKWQQARLLDVLGCPPKEFIYGFDDIDGISRKIKEYKEKIKQFKKINKKKLVALALTVLTAHRLSGKLYNNRLPHKKEIQKIFDKKTNGINPYVFSALHYGFGVPFDVCKEFKGDMAQELLNTMNDLHPKRGIKKWKPICLEGIALQVDTTFAKDMFKYNPFKDAEDLLDICIKKDML